MPSERKTRKGQKIAPATVWDILPLDEKEKMHEVLIQIAEEIITNYPTENSSDKMIEEIVINDTRVH